MTTSVDPTAFEFEVDPIAVRMRGRAAHGNTPFDVPFISEIVPGLWQGGCRDGLVLPDAINHVVSLYPWEQYETYGETCRSMTQVYMYDSTRQDPGMVDGIAQWVNTLRKDGTVLVHCQAGLNRSSLIVARALILEGMEADAAIALIRKQRSSACLCNPAFESWLRVTA